MNEHFDWYAVKSGGHDQTERARAKAPELLECLRVLYNWAKSNGHDRTPSGGVGAIAYEGTEYEIYGKARALIAEIGGGEV